MSFLDDLLFEALQRGTRLDEENRALHAQNATLLREISDLKIKVAAYAVEERQADIRARLLLHCESCNDERWIWFTCGEGTCEMNDPCETCNADQALPMNWDAVK